MGGINHSRAAAVHPLSITLASVQRARLLVPCCWPPYARVQQWSADLGSGRRTRGGENEQKGWQPGRIDVTLDRRELDCDVSGLLNTVKVEYPA